MSHGQIPNPFGQFFVTISFHNVGRGRKMNEAQMIEECVVTFALQPVESESPIWTISTTSADTCITDVPDLAADKVESRTTGSESSWSLISRWLEDCLTTHEKRTQLDNDSPASFYPTRMIDIGNDQSSVNSLCESKEQASLGLTSLLVIAGAPLQ